MNNDNIGQQAKPDVLDADAVCAQCNTVNTEGTLLCKVCGNNLRDQRMTRLAADQEMDLERTGQRRRGWISGILFVLAIFLIISTLLNQDVIVEWLVNPGGDRAANLWSSEGDQIYEPMTNELAARNITEEDALAALETALDGTSLDGAYALFANDVFAGSAIVSLQGTDLYFVALLEDGGEVRGKASAQGNYYAALPEFASVRNRGRVSEVRGVAMPQGDGVVECIGDYNNTQISFVAYHMPEI